MDVSGLTTFFTAILDAAVKIAALVAAVSIAAAGFMYFGVVGHNQRAMESAQNGVRAAFLGLAFVWGAKELINLVAGAAGQAMSEQSPVVYSVPTHLREREPFAFGRTLGEVAKLVVVGFVAARLVGSAELPPGLRIPAAAVTLLVGASWALLRIQRRPLDGWLTLAFQYGTTPRRRVWRPGGSSLAARVLPAEVERERGWYQLERVRVRWAEVSPSALNGPLEDKPRPTTSGGTP